jgi:hypothetical protein
MREGACLALVEDGARKKGRPVMREDYPRIRENTRPGGNMERAVGEHTAEFSQPGWKGAVSGKITALEAAYEGCR